jgi:hypothetical protein
MIFSRFTKKKWQNKDSNIRIAAINNELSLNNDEQRQIIEQLASEDTSELVRRAALLKIADFKFWLKNSKTNSMAKVKQFSTVQVENMLLGKHDIVVDDSDKRAYINDHNDYSFFETWLKIETQPDLIIALFEKIAGKYSHTTESDTSHTIKPQLLVSLFSQIKNQTVQGYIVDKVNEIDTLEKLVKKAAHQDILALITAKIAGLRSAIEQPIKLRKKVSLVLAKLLALKDQSDYGVYITKRESLLIEWQSLFSEFSCLPTDESTSFVEKQEAILIQLDKLFVVKAEQFAQAKIVAQLEQEKVQVRQHFDKSLTVISQTLTTSIFENEQVDEQKYQSLFDKLTSEIIASVLIKSEQNDFLAKICSQQQKLKQLPEIAESVSEATHLISKMSQLAVPANSHELNERLPLFKEWQAQWQTVEFKSAGTLPESIKNAAQEIRNIWQKGIKPIQQLQKQEFSQAQKKINDVKRLINSGKYNAAFGVFKRVEKLYSELSANQQHNLQRDYDNVSTKIAELADWEHYIATPRKQQLLKDITLIVEQPLDNPNEQAEKVKQYRNVWNSLGHADDDAEKALNFEFNQLCESAFAPCRLYFAEQEQLREQHLVSREAIIAEAQTLAKSDGEVIEDHKLLETSLNKLQKKWRDAGQVDRNVYKMLNQRFNDALKPLKSMIKRYHEQNISAKEALISAAKLALTCEDINDGVNKVKSLQKQWRTIGYAGLRLENKLWQDFRQVNDQVFGKRDQAKLVEHDNQQQIKLTLETQLAAIEEQLQQASSLDDLNALLVQLSAQETALGQVRPKMNGLYKNVEKLIAYTNAKIDDIKKAAEMLSWQNLFILLEEKAVNQGDEYNEERYSQLLPVWQKRLNELAKKQKVVDRSIKTLELEILAGVSSPQELKHQRMQAQVALMQSQMQSDNKIDLPALLADWVNLGALSEQDIPLLQRLKTIFVH